MNIIIHQCPQPILNVIWSKVTSSADILPKVILSVALSTILFGVCVVNMCGIGCVLLNCILDVILGYRFSFVDGLVSRCYDYRRNYVLPY